MAALYFGKEVLIPLSLAILLSFVLSAPVKRLEMWHFGRLPSVLIVMLLTLAAFSGIGWIVSNQLLEVLTELPQYKSNIERKLEALRGPQGGSLAKATKSVQELSKELTVRPEQPQNPPSGPRNLRSRTQAPVPVEITEPPTTALGYVRSLIGPLLAPAAAALIVVVFTLVLLIRREDLRDRFVRLIGISQLTLATEAFDDAAQRLSRYLRMQCLVNTIFAGLMAFGLQEIGLPGALLWGVLAGMLRFIPYVGPIAGGGLPFLLSLAVFSNWTQPLLTLGLYLTLELITAYCCEPWLYGRRTGISALAILVAATFWAAIWGPVGLILSTPLTVCLVVMGRYVPRFEFLPVLLGDEPVLPPAAQVYQRLLAMDQHEARAIINEFLKERTLGELYDIVLIPALSMAEADRHRGTLEKIREEFLMQSVGELIAELAEQQDRSTRGALTGSRVICLPAKDQADELAAAMLAHLLDACGIPVVTMPPGEVPVELLGRSPEAANLVCISAVPPFAVLNARSLSKKLQSRYPGLKIVVGVWNAEADRKAEDRIDKAVSGDVVTTLAQAMDRIRDLLEMPGTNTPAAPAA